MTASKETLDALMRAMEIEKETFDFYTDAERKTFSRGAKRIFHWLARTEEQHYLKLSDQYRSLDESGRWVFYGGSGIALEPEEGEGLFNADEVKALQTAMEIEKKSIRYFDDLIEKTASTDGKEILRRLREEEAEHLRVVAEKYRELSGE